jgi:hypothetical protein
MRRAIPLGCTGLLLTLCAAATLAAEPAPAAAPAPTSGDIGALVQKGTVTLNFRYRYEFVDDDAFDEDANASTLRSRLTLQSGVWRNFAFLAEFDDVREIVADEFNAGDGNTPGRTEYPVVADPEGTELNQAYVDFKGLANTTLRAGRQRINLDNQRFVGGVGWRQNEQTFDAASAAYDSGIVHLFYAWVEGVRRFPGDDVPAGDHEQDDTHIANARIDLKGWGALTGYYYGIDNLDAPAFSTSTFGARFAGLRDLEPFDVRYAVEFAEQSDAADNPVSYDASYYLLDGGIVVKNFDVGAGWEILEGDEDAAGKAFRTPLATLHAFNGWVDKFLTTPPEGLEDRYVKAKATFGNALFELRFHDFDGEDSGEDLGQEWDAQVGYQFHKRLRADLIAGDFESDDPRYTDTLKAWLMVTVALP